MKKTISAIIASLALTAPVAVSVATAGPAQAAGKYYSSCDKLHRDFEHGVAKNRRAAKKQVRDGYHRPAFGPKARGVYKTNHSRLDADDDGTACEA